MAKNLNMDEMTNLVKDKLGELATKRSEVISTISKRIGTDLEDKNKIAHSYVPELGMFVFGYTTKFFDNVTGQLLRKMIEYNGYMVIIAAKENLTKKEWEVQIQIPAIDYQE